MSENNCCSSKNQSEKKSIRIKSRIKNLQECKDPSCCSPKPSTEEEITPFDKKTEWITGKIKTAAGIVPRVSTELSFKERGQFIWGISREYINVAIEYR